MGPQKHFCANLRVSICALSDVKEAKFIYTSRGRLKKIKYTYTCLCHHIPMYILIDECNNVVKWKKHTWSCVTILLWQMSRWFHGQSFHLNVLYSFLTASSFTSSHSRVALHFCSFIVYKSLWRYIFFLSFFLFWFSFYIFRHCEVLQLV